MKRLADYLPPDHDNTPTRLLQAQVDAHLYDKVKVIMRLRGLTWKNVIRACLLHLVDELAPPFMRSVAKEDDAEDGTRYPKHP